MMRIMANQSSSAAGVAFEVLREAPVTGDLGQGPFDDPAFGQGDKVVGLTARGEPERLTRVNINQSLPGYFVLRIA